MSSLLLFVAVSICCGDASCGDGNTRFMDKGPVLGVARSESERQGGGGGRD